MGVLTRRRSGTAGRSFHLPLCFATLFALAALATGPGDTASAAALSEEWFTLESPHFFVHFPVGWEEAARRVVQLAEEVHQTLVPILEYEPDERTHIALTDISDVANGLTDVAYYNRVVLYPVSPAGPGYSSGFEPGTANWLRLLITHEYAHVLHLDMHGSAIRAMQRLLGRVPLISTPNILQPASFMEGYATHLESLLVPGGRTNGALYDMFLRTAALDGSLLDGDQALGQYDLDAWVPATAPYLYGAAFMDYLGERFGEERLVDVHWAFAELNTVYVDAALRQAFGVGFEQLWRDWRREATARYEEQAARLRSERLTPVEPWPSSFQIVTDPVYSPDGEWVAYASAGDTFPDVRVRSASGVAVEDRQVAKGAATEMPGLSWFPDSRRLVYSSLEYVDASRLYSDLYVVDVETGRTRRLTEGMRAHAPAVSPDGERVAFIARSGDEVRIVEKALESGAVTTLYTPVGDELPYSLAWSPGGDRLAIAMKPDGARGTGIAVLETARGGGDSPAVRWLTAAPGVVDQNPAWSPDGETVLFDSNRGGVYNLYAADAATGSLSRLTNVLTGAFDPAVSPGGDEVTFLYYTAEGYRPASSALSDLEWKPVDPLYGAGDLGGAAAVRGASGAGAAAEKRPYNPLLSMRPRYWIPVSETADGPQVGLTTGGMDALGERSYAATLLVGTNSGRTAGDVQYAQVLDDRSGWTLSVHTAWNDRASARLGGGDSEQKVRLDRGTVTFTKSAPRFFGGRQFALSAGLDHLTGLEQSEPTGPSDWVPHLGSSLTLQHVTGEGQRTSSRQLVLAGSLSWPGDSFQSPDARVTADWATTRELSRVSSLGFAGHVAHSNAAGAFTVGGVWDAADMTVRGLETGTEAGAGTLSGQSAAGSTVEWERRLARIERGVGASPVFFNSLYGALFADAATLQDAGEPWTLVAGAGGELRLRTELDYGRYAITWRIGAARAWQDGAWQPPHFYLALNAAL